MFARGHEYWTKACFFVKGQLLLHVIKCDILSKNVSIRKFKNDEGQKFTSLDLFTHYNEDVLSLGIFPPHAFLRGKIIIAVLQNAKTPNFTVVASVKAKVLHHLIIALLGLCATEASQQCVGPFICPEMVTHISA